MAAFLGVALALPAHSVADEVIAEGSHWDDDHCTILTDLTVLHTDGRVTIEQVIGGEVDGIAQVQFPLYGVVGPPSLQSALVDYVQTKTADGTPLHWEKSCVFMTPNSAGTSQLPFDGVLGAIDGAAAAWTQGAASCSYMQVMQSPPEPTEAGYDAVNVVIFRDTPCTCDDGSGATHMAWCRPAHGTDAQKCYDPTATALTTVTFVKNAGSDLGRILDTDVEINTSNYTMAIDCDTQCMSNGPTGQIVQDLQNTLTHEFGHVLGLDHTCWVQSTTAPTQPTDGDGNLVPPCQPTAALPDTVISATMYPYQAPEEVSKRVPKPDDIAGVCAGYAKANDPKLCEPESLATSSGCSATVAGSSHASPRAMLVLLGIGAMLWTGRRRRR